MCACVHVLAGLFWKLLSKVCICQAIVADVTGPQEPTAEAPTALRTLNHFELAGASGENGHDHGSLWGLGAHVTMSQDMETWNVERKERRERHPTSASLPRGGRRPGPWPGRLRRPVGRALCLQWKATKTRQKRERNSRRHIVCILYAKLPCHLCHPSSPFSAPFAATQAGRVCHCFCVYPDQLSTGCMAAPCLLLESD